VSGANEVQAVVLRRKDSASPTSAANPTRVVLRMSGPNTRTASGSMPVTGADRRAMREGSMTVALFDRSGMSRIPPPHPTHQSPNKLKTQNPLTNQNPLTTQNSN
jgi:hypothetical protein